MLCSTFSKIIKYSNFFFKFLTKTHKFNLQKKYILFVGLIPVSHIKKNLIILEDIAIAYIFVKHSVHCDLLNNNYSVNFHQYITSRVGLIF